MWEFRPNSEVSIDFFHELFAWLKINVIKLFFLYTVSLTLPSQTIMKLFMCNQVLVDAGTWRACQM